MAILKDVKNSIFYSELSDDNNNKYFDLKRSKFLHNIDTLYYSVFLKGDSNDDERVKFLIDDLVLLKEKLLTVGFDESVNYLEGLKEIYESKEYNFCNSELESIKEYKKINFDELKNIKNLEITRGRHADYTFKISLNECFDIYVVKHIQNSNTPRILVQIRSYWLWVNGIDKSIHDSYNCINEILSIYNFKIDKIQENRIDYCYHTNSIQSPRKFFSIEKLEKNCFGSLTRLQLLADLRYNSDGSSEIHYISLGNRKSNNLFFRIYNKTKEVIEMNYKCFFFDIWHKNGLINSYDKYCYEYAYKNGGKHLKIYEGALKFYLENGKNEILKKDIYLALNNFNTNEIKDFALTFMPPITQIINIEFETKRKYYYYYRKSISLLPPASDILELDNLFKIINNRKLFLNMLTHSVVRFSKSSDSDSDYLDFWKRLRSVKISYVSNVKLNADYSRKVDKEKLLNRAINSIASFAAYDCNSDIDIKSDITTDITDILSNINDNDSINHDVLTVVNYVNVDTGEVEEFSNSVFNEKYYDKKQKKYKQTKNLLKH